ncbi:MAG: cyanoexosortase A [Cyanothece sp. SIO1E1]|nr:cyanoexosortase A [Cyanothece sp. SIO1E1]
MFNYHLVALMLRSLVKASLLPLHDPRYWLLCIGAGLCAIHLTLVWRLDNLSLWCSSLLFWAATANLNWTKRHTLTFKASVAANAVGVILLGLVLIKTTAITGGHFLQLYPLVVGLALALLASGFWGIWQFRQELMLFFFLGVPGIIVPLLIDLSNLTARFSTMLLWYLGFDVVRQGVNVYLPGGGVEVNPGCDGLQSMLQVLGISVLCLTLLPVRWRWGHRLVLPLIALAVGFGVNGVRVALMAVLVAEGKKPAFDYWHLGNGSLIFSMIAVLLFMLLCMSLLHNQLLAPTTPKRSQL